MENLKEKGEKIMIFWLCLAILIIGIGLIVLGCIDWDYEKNKLFDFLYDNDDTLKFIGGITTFISGFIMIIMITILCCMYIDIDARVEQSKETFDAITYKVESGACRDEFGLLNKEVIDEIQSWNESIIYNQKMQNDFWVGVFYPNIYDQFETIDYEKYGRE